MSFKLDKPTMFSVDGYKRYSKDVHNKQNLIASGDITMKDVDFIVHGIDNLGNEKIMEPGKDYSFPGDIVLETPLTKESGFKLKGFPMHEGTESHLKQTIEMGAHPRQAEANAVAAQQPSIQNFMMQGGRDAVAAHDARWANIESRVDANIADFRAGFDPRVGTHANVPDYFG